MYFGTGNQNNDQKCGPCARTCVRCCLQMITCWCTSSSQLDTCMHTPIGHLHTQEGEQRRTCIIKEIHIQLYFGNNQTSTGGAQCAEVEITFLFVRWVTLQRLKLRLLSLWASFAWHIDVRRQPRVPQACHAPRDRIPMFSCDVVGNSSVPWQEYT